MNSTYNINGKTFSTFDVFKPIATGEKIAILYTNGIKSHLLALMAKQIYGIENIVFVLNTPEEYFNFKDNPTKLSKVISNFNNGLTIKAQFPTVKFLYAGHNNMHEETIQLLLNSGWDKGLINDYQLYNYLNENSTKYTELHYYVNNLDYKIPATNKILGFEQINHYYNSVQKPFKTLTTVNIIKFYQILNLQENIFDSNCCPVLTTKSHCGYCNDCLGRKYALSQAEITDKTEYN